MGTGVRAGDALSAHLHESDPAQARARSVAAALLHHRSRNGLSIRYRGVIRLRPREPADGNTYIGVAFGALSALLVSFALLPLRDHLPNADMALALVLPVLVGAIIGGRLAGLLTAFVASL